MNEHHIEAQLKKAVEASGGLCWKLVCPGTTGVVVTVRSGSVRWSVVRIDNVMSAIAS